MANFTGTTDQDISFWPLEDSAGVLVMWAPLSNVDSTNGCLQVAVGSHREPVGPLILFHSGEPQLADNTAVTDMWLIRLG